MPQPTTDQLINSLAEIVRPVVEAIERGVPSTKDNYAEYMAALTNITGMLGPNPSSTVYLGVGVAMQRAGGNKNGIAAALRAMGHI